MNLRATAFLSIVPLTILALAACSDDDTTTPGGNTTVDGGSNPQALAGDPTTVLTAYADNLHQAFADSVTDTAAFSTAVDAFVATPSETTHAAVKAAWIASRAHYMLTEGSRFYDGPIDLTVDGRTPDNYETALNSWPLDEAYIDYTTGNLTAGFVNNPASMETIDIDALNAANFVGGDENVSNGWHAAEFLIWGQATDTVGPGKRPFTDYTTYANVDRRSAYLKATVVGISQNLTAVRDAWQTGATYREKFITDKYASVAFALGGLGRFSKGELAGERINAAYVSRERRDQHDCFSSETLTDYKRDAEGVKGLYLGDYAGKDGPGFDTLVAKVDPALDTEIKTALDASIAAIDAIKASTTSGYFEEAIGPDATDAQRATVLDAINKLRAQGDLFGKAATALGLSIEVPESNP